MIKTKRLTGLILLAAILLGACAPNPEPTQEPEPIGQEQPSAEALEGQAQEASSLEEGEGEGPMAMALTSPAFNHGDAIPAKFTCDGEDISPDLDWFGTPPDTVSLALIMDDPDAPGGTWVHWVLYNLPVDLTGLRPGMTGVGLDGSNSWNTTGYGGPCPPSGTHRYVFKLYALDLNLDLAPGVDKGVLLAAMEGHILGQAELMGTYSR